MLGRRAWALACPTINSVEKLALLGMAIYATNTVTARLRHAASLALGDAETLQALRQCVKESAKGHGHAIKILREVWTTDRSSSEASKNAVCARKRFMVATTGNSKKRKTQNPRELVSRGDSIFHPFTEVAAEATSTEDKASGSGTQRMIRATILRCDACGREDTWCVC